MTQNANRIELNVQGMTCGHCQSAVQKALAGVPGVTAATVDLASGRATVTGTPDMEGLISAVAEEGYTASTAG